MMKSVARSGESTGIELAGVVLTLWTRERVECVREELDRFGAERTPEGESCILSRWGTLPPLMWPSFSTESKVAKLEVRSVSQEDKKSFSFLGHTLYFQLPNRFPTYFVVEFVTKTAAFDSTVFWTSFDPFSHLQHISDLSTPAKHTQLRFPLFYGSPRSLFFLKSPLLDSKSPVPVPGCLLICSLTTHKALQCTSHLFPPF